MTSRHRITARAAAAIAALTVLAGCATSVTGSPQITGSPQLTGGGTTSAIATGGPEITTPSGGPTSTAGPSQTQAPGTGIGPIPAGLDKFYRQQLSWGGCADYATTDDDRGYYADRALECARLTVPLAYDKPDGPTITIAVLRKVATDKAQRIGSVLFNPGGPGASGASLVAQLASYGIADVLNERFDLVGFDPRGVGASQPVVTCLTGPERDAERAQSVRTRTAAEVQAANDEERADAQKCAERTGKDQGIDGKEFLANVGTRDVAKDMDVLRAALGDRQLTYVGYSYGTRIGYVYAEQFPANVRAMVLDGAVAPDQDPKTELLAQAKGFQDAFNDFATWCAKSEPACVLGTDPGKATAVYQSLVRPLLDKPLPLADGRVLSFGDANTGTIQALYSDTLRKQLATALLNLSKGDGKGLMALADQYDDRAADGTYSSLQDAFTAIRCVDDPRITDPAELTALNAAYAKAAPFADSGDPAGAQADICAFWPVPPTLTPHKLDIPGLAKVLVVSTKGDPATPYQAGVDLAEQLHGALLSVNGTRHTGYLLALLGCVDKIGNDYLLNLTVPAAGTTCS